MVPPKAKAEKRPNQAFLTSPQQPFRTGRDIGSYARPEDRGNAGERPERRIPSASSQLSG